MAEELPLIQISNTEYNRAVKSSERRIKAAEREKERNKKSTANKNGKSSGPLAFLRYTNEWLEDMPTRINSAFNNFVGDGERTLQSKVDIICAWLAWKVNIAIERKRQAVIKILYDQYGTTVGGKVMAVAGAVQNFVSDPIGAIAGFASSLFSPVTFVFKFITELLVEILKLAENLARIVSALPPSPPNPHINYDKFKLKVGSISMADVMTDPRNLPSPEVMFPEPKKPFSKDTFAESFENTKANLKSNKIVYKLSEDDKKTLEAMNEAAISMAESALDDAVA